jgi:ribosomal protein L29
MKKKELKELSQKTLAELRGLLSKAQVELAKLKLESRAGKIKNQHLIGQKNRQLAQIKTIITEKELNENT